MPFPGLAPWALLCRAFSARADSPLSLTRMPCRAAFPFVLTQGFGRFAALPWALLFLACGASDVRQN